MVRPRDVDEQDLLRPAEVAAVFGVSTKTVTRWGRTGRLRVLRTPGGHMRFSAEDVHLLARTEVLNTTSAGR